MNSGKTLIILALVAILILQSFIVPRGRYSYFRQLDDEFYDENIDYSQWSKDSLQHSIDSILATHQDSIVEEFIFLDVADSIQHKIDSVNRRLFLLDSIAKAKIAFQHWFDSIPKKEQKIWIKENIILPAKIHKADSILAVKDSIKAYKDSVIQATPRIFESPFLPDSLWYKRILKMNRDLRFGDIKQLPMDTTYNDRYYDYPFMKQDINASWVGTSGSAVQEQTWHKRKEEENGIFFTPYRTWTYEAGTLPMYNTKTPYTELGYWGTLLSGESKEEINLHVLTTQNITPESNITFLIDKFGGQGRLQNEKTSLHNLALSGNYLGKKYSMHAGWIMTKMEKKEGGGITDNTWIRDTTVDTREIQVYLSDASNFLLRNTLFINQSFRMPFGSDSLTTAFLGHTTEYTNYIKVYRDRITDAYGRKYYNNNFYLNPSQSGDTMNVIRLDNKIFMRLQPWKDQSALSKIDVGIGDKMLRYYDFYQDSLFTGTKKLFLNSVYAYAGARGMIKRTFNWDANTQIFFAGYEAGDFNVDANAYLNFYPFRKHRNSPLSLGVHFHTDLTTPDHYRQRLLMNHFKWDQAMQKESNTRISATLDIPAWRMDAEVAYTLMGNKAYFDSLGVSRQMTEGTANVLSAYIRKDFVFWKIHLDNKLQLQFSSNEYVAPVPLLSLNLRWYIQFDVVKNAMQMQIGANGLYNTLWFMPAYNPEVGVFYNQRAERYGNCPYIDVFCNIQWKRACIFLKGENINQGWPMDNKDYFSSHRYIHTPRTFKIGVYWPFYIQPARSHSHANGKVGGATQHGSSEKRQREQ